MKLNIQFVQVGVSSWLVTNLETASAFKVNQPVKILLYAISKNKNPELARAQYTAETGSIISQKEFDHQAVLILDKLTESTGVKPQKLTLNRVFVNHVIFRKISSIFSSLVSTWFLLVNISMAVIALTATVHTDGFNPVPAGVVPFFLCLGLLIASGIFHEIGHAAALVRYNQIVGNLGIGLYFIYPVFFTEMYKTKTLSRTGHLWINLAGVHFQILFATLLATLSLTIRWPIAGTASKIIYIAAFTQLLPINRSDGYWLIHDLLESRRKILALSSSIASAGVGGLIVCLMIKMSLWPTVSLIFAIGDIYSHFSSVTSPSVLGAMLQMLFVILWLWRIFSNAIAWKGRRHAARNA